MSTKSIQSELQRIENAEKKVLSLQKKVEKLKSQVVKAGETINMCDQAALLEENEKLRYRLTILKRAASELNQTPTKTQSKKSDDAMYSIIDTLVDLFTVAVRNAYKDLPDVVVSVIQSNQKSPATRHVDYQCNSALPITQALKAKGEKVKPSDVGEHIVKHLPSHVLIDRVVVAAPGFINIFINRLECQRMLTQVLRNGVLPPQIFDKKLRVVVDLSSPNIAKEMHVGHLRSTIIGDTICRLLEYLGHDVLRLNHVGDWGTQFGMLIAHLEDKFPNFKKTSPPIGDLQAFYKESKKRFDEDAEFKKRAYLCVVKLQNGEPDYIKAWNLICDVSRRDFQKIYDRLGIKLVERGESFYQERMKNLVKELEERNLLITEEGRKLIWADNMDVPFTIVKSDGGFTYDTSDLASIRYRIEEEGGQWLIYVVDAGQSQHFEILRQVAIKIGFMDPKNVKMDFVGFGVVLGEDKKKFKTRSGDTVRLVDLLDEGLKRALNKLKEKGRDQVLTPEQLEKAQKAVAYGCIKYADLLQNRNHEYVFSFDKMLDDKGNTAVYLLYALTRIRSIARNAGINREQINAAIETTPISIEHEKEWKLVKALVRFPEVLSYVMSTWCPHHLCEYVYEVAVTFSEFYDSCYCIVKNPSGEVTINMGRILLTEVTASILEKGFFILGLEPVERM